MKTKITAFILAAILSASVVAAGTKTYKVGNYIIFHKAGDTSALVCVRAEMHEA